MTPQEIQERNKQIALMLGFKYKNQAKYWGRYPLDDNSFLSKLGYVMMCNLKFHSDWNWLMKAVEFIERLSVYHMVETNRSSCVIYNGKNIITANYFKADKTKKEAVFIAVSDFAQKFNNKEL
jgi:hypothetical protein